MPNEADKQVGKKLRLLRQEKKWSQRDLAARINITFQQIQKYEKGINRISIGTLYDICSALEITPAEFLKDFYQDYKVAESTLTPLLSQVVDHVRLLPVKLQKNVLKYVKTLNQKEVVNKEI